MYIKFSLLFIIFFSGCTQQINKPTKSSSSNVLVYEKPIEINIEQNNNIIEKKETQKIENKENRTIGLIFPSKEVGKYALEATNSISTYLIYKGDPFDLESIDIQVQTKNRIENGINQLKDLGITKVILMITKSNLKYLKDINGIAKMKIYLPLINKVDISEVELYQDLNVIFGAINYKEQFEKLIQYSGDENLVEFYDNSALGETLHNYLKDKDMVYVKRIDNNNGSYKRFLKNNTKLEQSSILLNTPIIKSSILLSAIASNEVENKFVLSTQLNYTPLLFSLTQRDDRKKLIVASSIGDFSDYIEQYNQLIGNDITYSWVNYSVMIGVEYLIGDISIFKDISLQDKQIIYPVRLYKVGVSSFIEIK